MVYIKPPFVHVLFLDIDGTVRKGFDEIGKFVNSAADVEVFPEVPGILEAYKAAGWRIAGVTNQGGIALGHVTLEDAAAALQETNRQCGGVFDKMMLCPHHPESKDPTNRFCWCRKPLIGSLIQAGLYMSSAYAEIYIPNECLMVGDRPEDAQCAANANVKFMEAKEWRARGPVVYQF